MKTYAVGLIIGASGETIENIQNYSQSIINIDKDRSNSTSRVNIKSPDEEHYNIAVEMIQELVSTVKYIVSVSLRIM